MFLVKLKRQYWYWCLTACSFGIVHIINDILTFDALSLIVDVFMVLTLGFLFYCGSYFFISLFRWLRKMIGGT